MSVVPARAEVAQAYEHCRLVTRRSARNFYFAFLSLPPRHRPAIYTLYAFCRACDDYADEEGDPEAKLALLRQHREGLRRCLEGSPSGPIFVALHDVLERYPIPPDLFVQIIEGVEMDLAKDRYATFADLHEYCYRVASVVGLISIEIFGYSDERARQCAIDTGIAMQLVNILRDLKEDGARGRVYLPQEDLERFGYTETALLAGVMDQRFAALIDFQAARAREYFRRGAPLLSMVPRESRACPATLTALYARLLQRMESKGWDVFSSMPRLLLAEKLWIAARLWSTLAFRGPVSSARPSS